MVDLAVLVVAVLLREGADVVRAVPREAREAEGQDINVSLKDYVKGDETAAVFLGEAAIWR